MDLKPKTLIKLLEQKGYVLDRISGSHHIFFNSSTNEIIPVPIHGNKDIKKGLFFAILKKAGIERTEIAGIKKKKK